MADIKPTAQSLLNGITNDVKTRSLLDGNDAFDFAPKPFTEMVGSANQPNKVTKSKDTNSDSDVIAARNDMAATIADVKAKIKARLKEIAEKGDVPVKEKKALEALQKVATFLLKADSADQIELPKELTQKLNEFLAKGDELNAADIASFMRDFIDVFRNLKIALPTATVKTDIKAADGTVIVDAATAEAKPLTWPQEIVDAFKDLDLPGVVADPTKPINIMDALRAVKALVNESEDAALETMDFKSKLLELPQDQASILVVGTTVIPQTTTDAAATVDASAEVKAPVAPAKVDATAASLLVQNVKNEATKTLVEEDPSKAVDPNADLNAILAAAGKPTQKETKVGDAIKQQHPMVTALQMQNSVNSTAFKANAKDDTPSLSDISLSAQAPGRDTDYKTNRDAASSARSSGNVDAAAQLRSNPIVVAAPALNEIRSEVFRDDHNNPVMGPSSIDNSAKNVAKAATALPSTPSQPSTATQQIIAQIQQKGNKATSISVQLTPAELGRVEVRLDIKRDGQVHTIVTVDNPETLALLQKDSAHLERSLQQAGLNANSENMSFNLRDQNQANQFGQERKRFSRDAVSDGSLKEVTMNVLPEGQIFSDNRVNYHA